MYDVTNRSSFDALSDWLIEMRNNLPRPTDMDSVVFVVCANKVRTSFIYYNKVKNTNSLIDFPYTRKCHNLFIWLKSYSLCGVHFYYHLWDSILCPV